MDILLVDNRDSFTRNLEHLLAVETGGRIRVVPYSSLENGSAKSFDMAVISPGPGRPEEYTGYGALLEADIPVLGVCLGMQIINIHFGGSVVRLAGCVHGRSEEIDFQGRKETVSRYHSLCVEKVADDLEVLAENEAGTVMAIRHRRRKILGYQFHPESFLTTRGGLFIDYALRFFQTR